MGAVRSSARTQALSGDRLFSPVRAVIMSEGSDELAAFGMLSRSSNVNHVYFQGSSMRKDTIAVHGGFDCDPTTKAVAVPIYQTVAYSFDSAAHGAALFDLEVEGYRYTRIGNPTTTVLERRVAELEGGIDALAVASGQTAMYYTALNLAERGQNLVSVPQLYGTTHTLFAHLLPKYGIQVRFGKSDRPADLEKLIDENTRALFCETVGNPAG